MASSLTPDEAGPLLILGSSTRAAAFSALRAGRQPACADMFADDDLQAVAPVVQIDEWPRGLAVVATQFPRCEWLYTGGLENRPELVAAISERHHLLGNGAATLQSIRDPQHVTTVLKQAGLPALAIRPDAPRADGAWMLKPLQGGGGNGITVWDWAAANSGRLRRPHYFQERASGTPISAVYLARPGETLLIGATRQWIGEKDLCAPQFGYCGSVGPIGLPPETEGQLHSVGRALTANTPLRGLFGCDFILGGSVPWLTEVNPRYTASVEVYERACGLQLLKWHCDACHEFDEPSAITDDWNPAGELHAARGRAGGRKIGKAILFAREETTIRDRLIERSSSQSLEPSIADIPALGARIPKGHPICTVFSAANDDDSCAAALRTAAQRVYESLQES